MHMHMYTYIFMCHIKPQYSPSSLSLPISFQVSNSFAPGRLATRNAAWGDWLSAGVRVVFVAI